MRTSHSYKCFLITTESRTSGHVPEHFENALNKQASEGYRFVQALRVDDLRFALIFERMDG